MEKCEVLRRMKSVLRVFRQCLPLVLTFKELKLIYETSL